jgi:hypothetical protein
VRFGVERGWGLFILGGAMDRREPDVAEMALGALCWHDYNCDAYSTDPAGCATTIRCAGC